MSDQNVRRCTGCCALVIFLAITTKLIQNAIADLGCRADMVSSGRNEGFEMNIAITLVTMIYASWQPLEPGLEFGTFEAPQRSQHGDSKVRILRIDPKFFGYSM